MITLRTIHTPGVGGFKARLSPSRVCWSSKLIYVMSVTSSSLDSRILPWLGHFGSLNLCVPLSLPILPTFLG